MKTRISSALLILLAVAAVALHPARLFPAGVATAPAVTAPVEPATQTAQAAAPLPAPAMVADAGGIPSQSPPVPAPAASEAVLPERLSPGMDQVVRLARTGTPDSVMIAFIENAGIQYNPTPDELFFLRELRVSENVLVSLIQRKNKSASPVASQPGNVVLASTGTFSTAQAVPQGFLQQAPITINNNVSVPQVPVFAPSARGWCPPMPVCGPYSYSSPSGRFRIYSNGYGYGAACDAPVLVVGPRSGGGYYMQPFGPGYSTPVYGPAYGYRTRGYPRSSYLSW